MLIDDTRRQRQSDSPDQSVSSLPSTSSDTPFSPPPLPPRPSPARKPVPPFLPEHTRPRAPPLPPRPVQQVTYIDENVNPTVSEKGFQPVSKRQWYPATRFGRILFWSILALIAVTIIAVIAAVCAVVIPRSSSSVTTTTSYDGGNPLSAADGGVTIGEPGSIAVFGNMSTDHFVMTTNRSSFVTRLDPIVNPGALGSHLHRIHGSSYFTENLIKSSDMIKLANCTTTVVQDDKSAYWVAQMFYRYPNGTMVGVPLDRTSLYYFLKAPTGVTIYPFPDNYNIVAGDPYRRYFNSSDPTQSALWFQCYRGDGNDLMTRGFPASECSGGLVQAIVFPSCWDGVYADDADYSTHVTYPTDGPNGYTCPSSYPKKFITIQFETVFAVYRYPFNGENDITWVLANGDTTGYGIHADFMNGWDPDTLDRVVVDCRYMNATHGSTVPDDPANCPILNKTIDLPTSYWCRSQTPVVNETVGDVVGITTLPGCNALWSGNGSKPACPSGTIEGGTLVTVQPKVWYEEVGYIS